MGELFRRVRYLLNRRRLDRELESDMEFHREMAAREGKKNFGNVLRLREESREAWGWTWIDRLLQDLGYGVRMLRRSPGFTLTAVLVLAVGIGINVAAFSFFNVVMLQLLPIRNPETIVRLQRRSPEASTNVMSYPQMAFYRDHAKTLQAVMGTTGARLELDDDVQAVGGTFVTENYFTELGVQAAYGRLLDPVRDGAADASPVAVSGYKFWQRRFGSDPSVVGRTIRLNKNVVTVVGVTADDFVALANANADVWLPISQMPYFVDGSKALTDASAGTVEMWGRLAPGITATMAEQELLSQTNEYRKLYPKVVWDKEYVKSDPGGHFTVANRDAYLVLGMMGTLAVLILAVACANLGGLLMARGVTREREIDIRIAVGAGKLRIFRQLDYGESAARDAGINSRAGAGLYRAARWNCYVRCPDVAERNAGQACAVICIGVDADDDDLFWTDACAADDAAAAATDGRTPGSGGGADCGKLRAADRRRVAGEGGAACADYRSGIRI